MISDASTTNPQVIATFVGHIISFFPQCYLCEGMYLPLTETAQHLIGQQDQSFPGWWPQKTLRMSW